MGGNIYTKKKAIRVLLFQRKCVRNPSEAVT